MKLIILIVLFLSSPYKVLCESYLGSVTKQVNFREGAGIEYPINTSLKPGTQMFIISLKAENAFYNIIDIATDKEGYVHKSFVKIDHLVKEIDQGVFTQTGQTEIYNPEIEVYNNTKFSLTLKLKSEV